MANVLKDAKVGFLTGSQSSVDTMLSKGDQAGAKHGYFYLTKDSHRLYVGNSDGSLSAVNEGVQTVTYLDNLPVLSTDADKIAYTGRFFYVQYKNSSAGTVAGNVANILCVYNGTSWVQINANTNTTLTGQTFTTAASGSVATITNSIKDSAGGDYRGNFTITGAGGIKVAASGKNVTLTGDKFTLSSANGDSAGQVKLNLTSTNGQGTSTVVLKNDPNTTSLSQSGNVVTITGRANKTLTIANAANNKTGFTVTVTDTAGGSVVGSYDPTIKYGVNGGTSSKLSGGAFTLSTYTQAEIDQLLRDLDAMEYRGTVGANGSAATTWQGVLDLKQKIGYTYLLSSELTIGGKTYQPGSLAIARGTEYTVADYNAGTITDTNLIGTINPTTLKWDIVTNTKNTDTTYTLKTNSNAGKIGFKLQDSIGSVKGEIAIKAGAAMSIAEDQTGANVDLADKTNTITIAHSNVGRTNTANAPAAKDTSDPTNTTTTQINGSATAEYTSDTITVPVVTEITTNGQGHVTGVNTVKYRFKDTHIRINSLSTASAVSGNVATFSTTIAAKDSNGGSAVDNGKGTATMKLESSSLTYTKNANTGNIAIDMTWGEF